MYVYVYVRCFPIFWWSDSGTDPAAQKPGFCGGRRESPLKARWWQQSDLWPRRDAWQMMKGTAKDVLPKRGWEWIGPFKDHGFSCFSWIFCFFMDFLMIFLLVCSHDFFYWFSWYTFLAMATAMARASRASQWLTSDPVDHPTGTVGGNFGNIVLTCRFPGLRKWRWTWDPRDPNQQGTEEPDSSQRYWWPCRIMISAVQLRRASVRQLTKATKMSSTRHTSCGWCHFYSYSSIRGINDDRYTGRYKIVDGQWSTWPNLE